MTLVEYLTGLNSAETQWGVWVNPENVNDYRVGNCLHESGGVEDGKEFIGTLERLSFGYQSESEAFEHWYKEDAKPEDKAVFTDEDGDELCPSDAYTFWTDEEPEGLSVDVLEALNGIMATWSKEEAEGFVDQLSFHEDEAVV